MKAKQLLVCVLLCAFGAQADTIYVDINHPDAGDSAGHGSEARPYKSIQAAVAAAKADDVIKVKPGVYDNNSADAPYSSRQKNRVVLDKKLRLESTGGAAETEIRGKFSDDYDAGKSTLGYGNGAIRGVLALAAAEGSVIRGFTFGNGSSQNDSFENDRGGGVYALANVYVVDCAFTNCWARRGGALEGGTAVRARFFGNRCGSWDVGTVDNAKLWNCLVHETKFPSNGYRTMVGDTCVNCTVISTGYLRPSGCTFRNCIVGPAAKYAADDDASNTFANSLKGDSTLNGVMLSPYTGDCRLPTGSDAARLGYTSNLSTFAIPDEFKTTDFAGNTIDYSNSVCDAGAIQGTSDPICGVCRDTGRPLLVDGWLVPAGHYFRPTTYPSQMRVTPGDDKPFAGLGEGRYYPLPDGACHILAPMDPAAVNSWWTPGAVEFWVDGSKGNDDTGTGTQDKPYKTIQKASDQLNYRSSLVHVMPGTYATGGMTHDGVLTRFYANMSGGGVTRFVAEGGPSKTFLVGSSGTEECRVVASVGNSGYVAFQGFTIRGGRTTGTHGGAAALGCTLVDCVVSNCTSDTSVFAAANLRRTRIVGNTAGEAMIGGSYAMAFCHVHGNKAKMVLTTPGNPTVLNCTFTGNVTPAGQPHLNYAVLFLNNSIVDANGCEFPIYTRSDMGENYLWNYVRYAPQGISSPNFIVADPRLAGTAKGDERLLADSPALTRGSLDWKKYSTVASYYLAQGDVNGRPLVFNDDGSMPMGCNQHDVAAFVEITAERGGLIVEGAPMGLTVIEAGQSRTLTVSAGSGATRTLLGFVAETSAGSETHYFAEEPTWTHTVDSAESSVRITALYDNNWYVDAVNGRDTNDGATPLTAKKTLAGMVSSGSVFAGDVINAAPGVYAEGQMMGPDHSLTYSRVVLPAGVSLIATEGRDVTFIEGANAPDEVVAAASIKDGCGQGATRCVYLNAGCRLEGFTLRKGRGYDYWVSTGTIPRDYSGAGVYGHVGASPKARVVDCYVTDCKTGTGVGAFNVVCYRCTFKNNGRSGSNVISGTTIVNCLIDGTDQGNVASDDCTIYGSTLRPTGGYAAINEVTDNCYNSIIMGQTRSGAHYYGCTFATNYPYTAWSGSTFSDPSNCTDCRFGTIVELNLGTDLRQTEASAQVIDQGFNKYLPPSDDDAAWDVAGAPRVMNYSVDVGAYEWDIRPQMQAILGSRVGSVEWVSSNAVVKTGGGKILLDGNGACIEMVASADEGATISLSSDVAISGAGTLEAYVNGEHVKTVTAADGRLYIDNVRDGDRVVLEFSGTGSASFSEVGFSRGFKVIVY